MKNEIVEEIYQLTEKFYFEIKSEPNEEERDTYVNKIERYIKLRQKLINQLPKDITKDEKIKIADTIAIQKKIDSICNKLKSDIESDIKKLCKQKQINKKYNNNYVQTDGKFIDKKR